MHMNKVLKLKIKKLINTSPPAHFHLPPPLPSTSIRKKLPLEAKFHQDPRKLIKIRENLRRTRQVK